MCDVCAKKVIEGLSKCMQAQAFYHFFVFPFNFFLLQASILLEEALIILTYFIQVLFFHIK